MIIVCGGIKGGSGKTSVAVNLAVMRAKAGKQVLLVDADAADNANATDFAGLRDSVTDGGKGFDATKLNGKAVMNNVPGLASRYDDTIIDVGGSDSDAQRGAMAVADALLLPVFPSSLDIWVLGTVADIVTGIRKHHDLRVVTFLNRADSSGTTNEEAAEVLRGISAFEYHEPPIVNRKVFRVAAGSGLAVVEVKPKDQKATDEISALYEKTFGEAYA